MKKIILSLSFMILFSVIGFSQAAVYFCPRTGAVGYSVNYKKAVKKAYKICKKNGGTYPKLVLSSYNSGYGAIAIGYDADGGRIIGVSMECGSLSIAESAARNQCIKSGASNIYILKSFYVTGSK